MITTLAQVWARVTRRAPGRTPDRIAAVEAALRDLAEPRSLAPTPAEPWPANIDLGDPALDPVGAARYPHPDAWPVYKIGPGVWVALHDDLVHDDDGVRAWIPGRSLWRPPRGRWPIPRNEAAG